MLFIFCIFSSAGNCGTQPTAGSADRHRRDTRMPRGILPKIDQLLGQKSNKNVDGRVRLFYFLWLGGKKKYTARDVDWLAQHVPYNFSKQTPLRVQFVLPLKMYAL